MLLIGNKEVFTTLEELVNPKHTALLIIDVQNDYVKSPEYASSMGWISPDYTENVSRIKRVLIRARQLRILVVHTLMTLYPDHLAESPVSLRMHLIRSGLKRNTSIKDLPSRCVEGTWGWKIVDELSPLPNELVIRKHRSSAFMGTNLDMLLRSNGIISLLIVGLVTHGCVLSTANDAPFFEYYPIIVRDCTASYDPRLHEAALSIMTEKMDIITSGELLEKWEMMPAV